MGVLLHIRKQRVRHAFNVEKLHAAMNHVTANRLQVAQFLQPIVGAFLGSLGILRPRRGLRQQFNILGDQRLLIEMQRAQPVRNARSAA